MFKFSLEEFRAKLVAKIAANEARREKLAAKPGLRNAMKARALGVLDSVLMVIVAAIAVVIGVFVIAQLQLALNTSGLTSSYQALVSSVFSTAGSAFSLLVIALIVLAAVAIISIVVGGLGGGQRQGM